MKKQNNRTWNLRIFGVHGQVGPDPLPPAPPAPTLTADDIQRLQFEREQATAEAQRLKREMDEIKKAVPTPEQLARFAELEEQHRKAEEDRLAKSGEFEAWRKSITDRHQQELSDERTRAENEAKRAREFETELNESLVSKCFSDAVTLFGPAGYTTMLPDMAQSYLGKHVVIEVDRDGNTGKTRRTVVVKDATGTPIMDPATGRPEEFSKAMRLVIDRHPSKQWMLRGSGKVGAGSPGGGAEGEGGVDFNRLKPGDFRKKEVRDAVRQKMNTSGGLQIGPGFEQLKRSTERG